MNSPSNDRRMLLLVPSAFLASLSTGIVNFAMLFIVKERFQAGAEVVGAFTASGSLAYFIGCLTTRGFAKRLGPRFAMATMCFGSAALFGLFLLVPSIGSAFAVYIIYSYLCSLFWAPLMAWLSHGLEGSALGRATSNFNLAWSVGGTFAPYIGGLLVERSLIVPVYVSIGLFILMGAYIAASSSLALSPREGKAKGQGPELEAEDRSTPLRYPAWIGAFLIYATLSVFFNIFPVFAKDDLGFSESKIGFLLLVRAASAGLGFWFLGRFEFWHFKRRFILLGSLLLLALELYFLPTRSALGLGIGLSALGLVQAICYTNSIFYGASGAKDRGRRMTIHEANITVGQMVGSITGGLLYQGLSWGSVFMFLGLATIGGSLGQILILKRRA